MRPHDTYIETHLGGGSVMLRKRPARKSIGVEIDPAVVKRWSASGPMPFDLVMDDAHLFLSAYQFTGRELVYADPPYLPSTRRQQRIYRHDYSEAQHVELLEILRSLPCAVVLSGYKSELYDDMLHDWRCVSFAGDSHTGPRIETAWLNYPATDCLHDHGHIGTTFRERERIRRRRDGLTRRIETLEPLERNALFERLADQHGPALLRALGGLR